MTFKEALLKEPLFTGNEKLDDCRGVYIIPTRRKHYDSGYNCMIFVVEYYDENDNYKRVRCEGHIDVMLCRTPSLIVDCDNGVVHLFDSSHNFCVEWEEGISTLKVVRRTENE